MSRSIAACLDQLADTSFGVQSNVQALLPPLQSTPATSSGSLIPLALLASSMLPMVDKSRVSGFKRTRETNTILAAAASSASPSSTNATAASPSSAVAAAPFLAVASLSSTQLQGSSVVSSQKRVRFSHKSRTRQFDRTAQSGDLSTLSDEDDLKAGGIEQTQREMAVARANRLAETQAKALAEARRRTAQHDAVAMTHKEHMARRKRESRRGISSFRGVRMMEAAAAANNAQFATSAAEAAMAEAATATAAAAVATATAKAATEAAAAQAQSAMEATAAAAAGSAAVAAEAYLVGFYAHMAMAQLHQRRTFRPPPNTSDDEDEAPITNEAAAVAAEPAAASIPSISAPVSTIAHVSEYMHGADLNGNQDWNLNETAAELGPIFYGYEDFEGFEDRTSLDHNYLDSAMSSSSSSSSNIFPSTTETEKAD